MGFCFIRSSLFPFVGSGQRLTSRKWKPEGGHTRPIYGIWLKKQHAKYIWPVRRSDSRIWPNSEVCESGITELAILFKRVGGSCRVNPCLNQVGFGFGSMTSFPNWVGFGPSQMMIGHFRIGPKPNRKTHFDSLPIGKVFDLL